MTVRCAIYTRKSTEEGLQQDFNSLDAQRESAEAYIVSQKANEWVALPTRYDDGGYSGGNLDRPAFQQLIADVESDKVDCIVIYKIDRLSRSLADFARIMETFERHNVTLVSVTQHFNTTSSMGRLTLNILLSFAQFEREMISERTKDKIGAMRRRGKHWGGHPSLGYDIQRPPESPGGARLVINPEEATQVRAMFDLYLQHEAMMPVVDEIARRAWRNKAWVTKTGKAMGNGVIDKPTLWRILTNVIYLGKISYAGEVYEGEHDAIIDPEIWQRVQATLVRNGRSGGHGPSSTRSDDALLRGLIICKSCGSAMTPTYTIKTTKSAGRKRYRYYVCGRTAKRGRGKCDCPTLPATEIEQFVVQEIAGLGHDPCLRDAVFAEARQRLAAEGEMNRIDR
jgi:site-specific DNA recombinase